MKEQSRFRKAFTPTSYEITIFSGPFTTLVVAILMFRWPGHIVAAFAVGATVSTIIIELVFVRLGIRHLLNWLARIALATICFAIYVHVRK